MIRLVGGDEVRKVYDHVVLIKAINTQKQTLTKSGIQESRSKQRGAHGRPTTQIWLLEMPFYTRRRTRSCIKRSWLRICHMTTL